MGVCGACVTGSEKLIGYLVNYARPFIYTTAPSQYTLASISRAFDFLASNIHLQKALKTRIRRFLDVAAVFPNRTNSTSAIQTCIIPGNNEIRRAATLLQQSGFDVRPIVYPTVPKGKERLRICLHVFNGDEEIISLAEALKQFARV